MASSSLAKQNLDLVNKTETYFRIAAVIGIWANLGVRVWHAQGFVRLETMMKGITSYQCFLRIFKSMDMYWGTSDEPKKPVHNLLRRLSPLTLFITSTAGFSKLMIDGIAGHTLSGRLGFVAQKLDLITTQFGGFVGNSVASISGFYHASHATNGTDACKDFLGGSKYFLDLWVAILVQHCGFKSTSLDPLVFKFGSRHLALAQSVIGTYTFFQVS